MDDDRNLNPSLTGAISYICYMSAIEQFYIYLKEMQETAKKIKPAPKSAFEKVVLPKGSPKYKAADASKREDNCLL